MRSTPQIVSVKPLRHSEGGRGATAPARENGFSLVIASGGRVGWCSSDLIASQYAPR